MSFTFSQSILFFGIISLTTMAIRALPFLLFPENKKTPKFILYLGSVLPYTIIGMLVIYCLKDVSFVKTPYGLPEVISIAVIVLLHLWKNNTLLSIGAGTVIYMFLVQFI
ncbi:AzlD domain-containing protein [Anaerocolumna sp. AGMB13025]|uniref:branched-chain amino acid transporter permease n=1 Tax=Anaerocolumna sp. AGMB13025 TaxID=3039116 RepID=UPI00241E50FB|nr:AzlD domain-containing protein [Anaerocolumna sp. AGMB13025]WFR55194.1 AzlD domain-containing protein [Anaerocolumna sp. AGMB13025]